MSREQLGMRLCEGEKHTGEYVLDNIVLVRSLTKDHAIPGLRGAYAVANPRLIAQLEASRPTSAPAQAALVATCAEEEFISTSRKRLADDRRPAVEADRLREALTKEAMQ